MGLPVTPDAKPLVPKIQTCFRCSSSREEKQKPHMRAPELPPTYSLGTGTVAGAGAPRGVPGAGACARECQTQSAPRAGRQHVGKEAEAAGDQGPGRTCLPAFTSVPLLGQGPWAEQRPALESGRKRGSHVVGKTTERCLRLSPYGSPCQGRCRSALLGRGGLCLVVLWSGWARSVAGAARQPSGRVSTATWQTAPGSAA